MVMDVPLAIEILMIHLWMMVLKNKNGLSMLARAVQRDGSNVDAKGQRCNIFQLECKIQEKPMLDSAIKSMVFSAVKNKKEPCQINPKQRTVLFQGREDDMPKKLNVLSVDVLPVIEEHGSNVGEELVVMLVLDTGRR
ncbi:hypothetical protein OsI_12240 [Oryza sativa Indica Group]|uniref:Uncharacterized protein n=1 Tax=Oryza sativa subsp. indica TaxID=39946 RepID=B8AKS2_ORYSI|nr:hypothetical protein OsI_12240 [Oryza sativa Indica Group]